MGVVQYLRKSLRPQREFSRFAHLNAPHPPFSFNNHTMERTPLFIISGNRRRHTEYSPYQRGLIAGVVVCEASPDSLKKRFEISKSFAQFILFNALQRNNDDSLSRSDRPRMLSIRDERHIIRIARRELKIIYRELRSRVEVTCSHDTLYRLLKEKSIIN